MKPGVFQGKKFPFTPKRRKKSLGSQCNNIIDTRHDLAAFRSKVANVPWLRSYNRGAKKCLPRAATYCSGERRITCCVAFSRLGQREKRVGQCHGRPCICCIVVWCTRCRGSVWPDFTTHTPKRSEKLTHSAKGWSVLVRSSSSVTIPGTRSCAPRFNTSPTVGGDCGMTVTHFCNQAFSAPGMVKRLTLFRTKLATFRRVA